MIKKIFFGIALITLTGSCVSSKIYEDLKDKNTLLKAENEALMAKMDSQSGNGAHYSIDKLNAEIEKLKAEKSRLAMDLEAAENNYIRLKDSYDALEANSSSSLSENLALNRKLLEQLEEKERMLAAKENELNEFEKSLAASSKRLENLNEELQQKIARIEFLEETIAAKEAKMKTLKEAISAALVNFEGNGLTVEQRNGKVYVSMENKLLFESGSWAVGTRGREAVMELGKVLAQNPEIAVLIEGHTDNVPYGGSGNIKDNWDLSTKRATAIVQILTENSTILKDNLTAAGRGEYAPVATNNSVEGKAKNRRIEVILTPKLDEITKLLNEM